MIKETINEYTGEIIREWEEEVTYKSPKTPIPMESVYDEETLKKYCSDPSRKPRGDIGYLVDFLATGEIDPSEMKLMRRLCIDVEIHNFTATTPLFLRDSLGMHIKTIRSSLSSLETKGLLRKVNTAYYDSDGLLKTLYWIHPKLSFRGSYVKWQTSCNSCSTIPFYIEGV